GSKAVAKRGGDAGHPSQYQELRPRGGVVTQRSAKPCTPVQFRAWPPRLSSCTRSRESALSPHRSVTTPARPHRRPSVNDMRRHIEELLARLEHDNIRIVWIRRPARARVLCFSGDVFELQLPPVRSAISYATALHEIGHVLGPHQNSRRAMVRERWAWQWARSLALVWTPTMECHAAKSLD